MISLAAVWRLLRAIVLFFVPRVVTEDVACTLRRNGNPLEISDYLPLCPIDLLHPDERDDVDAIVEADSFTWLGLGVTYRVWNLRPVRSLRFVGPDWRP